VLLRELSLVNFRNYVRLALVPGAPITVLRGDNGQGKSNLLEAIYFLATTRSSRAGSDRELVHWRARRDTIPFARLEARIARRDLELHVEIVVRADPDQMGEAAPESVTVPAMPPVAKQIKMNGLPTRAVDLVGQVNVVLFTPDDVALVAGAPAGRRRYLDITNSQVSGPYLRALQRYNRVLAQRNSLLRQLRERRQPRDVLEVWNDELVTRGALVVARRLQTVAQLNDQIGPLYRQLGGHQSTLGLVYHPTSFAPTSFAAGAAPSGVEEVAELYRARLVELAPREIEAGVSLVGPHRDDFSFMVDGVDLHTYGSRGQQRLAVLALKLSEGEFMRRETDESPILLLDDVLSELDPTRRGFVLEQAGREGQTLITTTDLGDFPPRFLAEATLFEVSGGTVERTHPPPSAEGNGYHPATEHGALSRRRVAE
jgi:DNA replication and repair protein RecF